MERREQMVEISQAFLVATLDRLSDKIAVIDAAGHILFSNRAWKHEDVEPKNRPNVADANNYLNAVEAAAFGGDAWAISAFTGINNVISRSSPYFSMEYPIYISGRHFWFQLDIRAIDFGGGDCFVITQKDVTPGMQAKLGLADQSNRHPLTGAPDRNLVDLFLASEIQRCRRLNTSISLALFQVEQYKEVRNTFGVLAADECLLAIYRSITQLARRPSDFVGQVDQQLFAVVLGNTEASTAKKIACTIQGQTAALVVQDFDGHDTTPMCLSCSIISVAADDTVLSKTLYDQVERHLVTVRAQGAGRLIMNDYSA